MTYAHITDGIIDKVGPLPRIWWDGDRWHDLRDDDGTHAVRNWTSWFDGKNVWAPGACGWTDEGR